MKENQTKQNSEKADLDQYLLLPIFFILLIFATVESRAQEAIQVNTIQVSAVQPEVGLAQKKLELTNFLDTDINNISGGELQRVAIAATAMKDASLYFFDEPA